MADINWQAIQEDYERGTSLRLLATRYGVSKSTIDRRAKMGQWSGTTRDAGTTPPKPDIIDTPPLESVTLAKAALTDLSVHLASGLTLKEHVMFSQSLTQYTKVIAAASATPETQQSGMLVDPTLIDVMTIEELDQLQQLLEQAKTRKLEHDNITQLRRA